MPRSLEMLPLLSIYIAPIRAVGRRQWTKPRIAGVVQRGKGVVKSAVDRMIGSAKLQAEGKSDQAAGKAQKALGKVKDVMSRSKQKTP
jgi:uncharacterized protein YjbJ (UPF0337 family)